jgi:aspartate aminotransferase-like enzyme
MEAKLFIPGPVDVSQRTYLAMCKPMIGHRSQDFKELLASLQPGLKELFGTNRPVYISTSSAWGVMEGAIRNLVLKGVVNCMNGAFSDKWYDVALRCGKHAIKCQSDWGKPILPEQLRQVLEKEQGKVDAVTIIHNETSTGTLNPLRDLCAVVKDYPEVLLVVDTVSSFSVVPIHMEELGIDVLLTGSQKALALPPGLALFAISERALERAKTVADRGYYFDFVEFEKNALENMTPSTPCISLIFALKDKLEEIAEEGLQNRFNRYAKNNELLKSWVKNRGFELFPEPGYESRSLVCVKNNRGIDVAAMVKTLKQKHGYQIDGGYGKLKGQTFRISNMGNETPETISTLLAALDDVLSSIKMAN